ncbi:MAG: tetratricopeptide repeat protein, partial [Bacteroidota bacterium]
MPPIRHFTKLALSLFLSLVGRGVCAQQYPTPEDSLKVYDVGTRAFELRTTHPDSAIGLAKTALTSAAPARDSQAMVSLWRTIGVVHYGRKAYASADSAFSTALAMAHKINFRVGRLLINRGNVVFQQKDYATAKEYFTAALERSAGKDTLVWMDAATNLAGAYINSNEQAKAIPHLQTALLLQRSLGRGVTRLPILFNLGYAQVKLNQREAGI